ncbi:sialidase family protein [Niabella ginsengisoli]|uniref:sialidase family protein n=1 Tax=Niabella ginsengisoli TaxID=522298 RepID=UPI0021D3F24F|nr:sialidase family protein [Niabella ginsengisoli]
MRGAHIKKFLVILVAICNTILCYGQGVALRERNFTIPIVKERGAIALSRIEIILEDTTATQYLKQLTLNLNGTTHFNELHEIKVFITTDSNYLSEEASLKAPVFCLQDGASVTNNTVVLKGNFRLNKKRNYAWIAIDIKASARVGNIVDVRLSNMQINGKTTYADSSKTFKYRIASAVRQAMQDNVNTSRIPGLATALNGDLLAIYDARYDSRRDLQGDIDIALSRSTDKGNTWQPLNKIIDMGTFNGLPQKFNGVSDPCILVDRKSGNIFIAGLWMHGVLDEKGKWINGLTDTSQNWNHQWKNKGSQPGFAITETAQFLIIKSTDNGKTWSEPINLTRMCKKKSGGCGRQLREADLP